MLSGFVALLLCVPLLLASTAPAEASITPIAVSGDALPGLPGTVSQFWAWAPPWVDDDGDVVLTGASGDDYAVVRWSQGSFTGLAATGDAIPGHATSWSSVSASGQNADGDVVLGGFPDAGATWQFLAVHLARGGTATFLSDDTLSYEQLWEVSRPHAVQSALYGTLEGIGHPGIFLMQAGVDITIALDGDSRPGGGYFGLPQSAVDLSASGEVAFTDQNGIYK